MVEYRWSNLLYVKGEGIWVFRNLLSNGKEEEATGKSERQRWRERNRNERLREKKINVNNLDSQRYPHIQHLTTVAKISPIRAYTSTKSL